MANNRPLGPYGTFSNVKNVDDGTHIRGKSPQTGPIGAYTVRTPPRDGTIPPPPAPSVPSTPTSTAPASQSDVTNWPLEDKFASVLNRTAPKLPAGLQQEFAALLTTTNLAIMAGTLALWAASHFFGVGEIIDLILLVTGAFFLGMAVFDVANEIGACLKGTVSAHTPAELDRAADHLARAISIIGVAAFMALLARVGSKLKSGKGGESGAGAAGEGNAARPNGETGGSGSRKGSGSAEGDGAGNRGQGKNATQEPANGQGKKSCACVTAGHPVDVINGNKVLFGASELDFSLAAPLPLHWQRQYSSDNPVVGWFGQGWSGPFSTPCNSRTMQSPCLMPNIAASVSRCSPPAKIFTRATNKSRSRASMPKSLN